MIIRSNPMFSSVNTNYDSISTDQATYNGITLKTLLLLGVAGLFGISSGIGLHYTTNFSIYYLLLFVSMIVGFITILIGRSNPSKSAICGIIYSMCEGMVLGCVTAIADYYYEGIALLAIIGTAVVFLVCLLLFSCGLFRNTSMLSKILMTLFISIILSYILLLICDVFNISGISKLIDNNLGLAIGIEALFVLYGSIMLFMNFNEVTYYIQSGATKDFEWMAAFGLLVSILYIYLEIIRLLMIILRNRD